LKRFNIEKRFLITQQFLSYFEKKNIFQKMFVRARVIKNAFKNVDFFFLTGNRVSALDSTEGALFLCNYERF